MNKKRKGIKIISVSFLIILCFIFGGVVKKRAFKYPYNPKQDYRYAFNKGFALNVETEIEGNSIDISQIPQDFSTVLAEIEIQSNLKGFLSLPDIRMKTDELFLYQNFECRAKGIRYLNISQFVQNSCKTIEFETKGCKLKSNKIKIFAYKNNNPSTSNILILAPHPDDAEIAAYGLYASYPENTFIATITAGDAGSMRYDELYSDSTTHYIKKGKVRVWNSITVPQLGGIAPENAINLGYFDASLKMMNNDTSTFGTSRYLKSNDINLFRSTNCSHLPDSIQAESTWRSLVNDLKFLILTKKPGIIVSTYPALDTHFDHKFTTIALIQAMKELNYKNCELWLYTNHYPITEMYPEGKLGSAISLPPHVEEEGVYFDRICSFPLSEELQSDKTIALDAMNDLRPDTQYRNTKASWLQTKQNFFDKLYLNESDYFRRSVRSNELFFVVTGENALQPSSQSKLFGDI